MNQRFQTASSPRVIPNRNFIKNGIVTIVLSLAFAALQPAPAHAWPGKKALRIVNHDATHLAHVAGHAAHVVTRTTLRSARQFAHFTTHTAHVVTAKTVHGVKQLASDAK
jgi:hypothetical protein